jgi:hypothetical protein
MLDEELILATSTLPFSLLDCRDRCRVGMAEPPRTSSVGGFCHHQQRVKFERGQNRRVFERLECILIRDSIERRCHAGYSVTAERDSGEI